jgi:hypothetical protein
MVLAVGQRGKCTEECGKAKLVREGRKETLLLNSTNPSGVSIKKRDGNTL